MNDSEFQNIKEKLLDGEYLLAINKAYARQFFMYSDLAPNADKILISCFYYLSYLFFFLAVIVAGFAFGYGALLAIPLSCLFFAGFWSDASKNGRIATVILSALIIAVMLFFFSSQLQYVFAGLLGVSLICVYLLYMLSSIRFSSLAIGAKENFDIMVNQSPDECVSIKN